MVTAQYQAAYIYSRDGAGSWTLLQTLSHPFADNFDYYSSAAISGNGSIIVFGDYTYNTPTVTQAGIIWIVQKQGNCVWMQQFSYNATTYDSLGYSVAINFKGDVVVGGAWSASAGGVAYMGTATIFKSNNSVWAKAAVLYPNDAVPSAIGEE